ncbi:hypothetical protein tooticki91_gp003 [Flavobacterium phage vB_FspS_tooticki9-1]|uniref:Uncharacterized protein n=31 Tax=Caudoviricetes TaxID=2731619 RepID=A0A6B9LGY8_9CAUD|nr:hypothetical protein HWC87_gp03 [Flavobacterium phage vB_FspS_filifjonk9-1]YP_009854655.1 hypothetical protein HWC88_gp03 [Flavobacterium phage vB_FspS_hattifnatt9-1]YP_009854732.1 hypothetical protein HWC89_gp04 [Flavobacterium phage vB_FspS_hemulen6-1]YP_009854859.1 hypothetical protein HWC91_gp04 [Flavobacterium phage vB_FspS_lillamy9-1]YP_009854932.1 hypothetical protein HWC92_gp04 [Flavobacterium phage vB_FspS_morran9-1]YP_009855004.1 hypothetical protein HWC93_gp03 [Flavobacterium pha
MEIYTKVHSFTLTKEQKKILTDLKANKVNVSKLIREIIFKELTPKVDKRKKPTIEDLKRSLENCF